MLEHITELPPKIAFIGPGCSIAAESVAETLPFWNLTEVSDKDRILLTHDYFFNKEFCPFQTRRLYYWRKHEPREKIKFKLTMTYCSNLTAPFLCQITNANSKGVG